MAQLTPHQALEQSTTWLGSEPDMTVADDGGISVEGTPPLALLLTADDERLVVTHIREEPGATAGRADAVMGNVPDRGTLVQVSASVAKSGVTFTFTNTVYLDGFSRHAVVTATNELVAAVDRIGGGPVAETRVQPAITAAPVGIDETTAEADDTAEGGGIPAGWAPTHKVPSAGMRAWDDPDPSTQPSSRLEGRVELSVAERRGDWARVVGVNGWTGWVDARKLEDLGPVHSGGTTIDVAGFRLRPLRLLAVGGLLLASLLPWVSTFGTTANSFEVSLAFLWDLTAAGAPYLGLLLIGLAAVALFLTAASRPNPGVATLAGIVTVAVAALFVVQMYRGVSDSGGTVGDVFDLMGVAPWVALASGVVLLASART